MISEELKDKELQAMDQIWKTLETINGEGLYRITQWLLSKMIERRNKLQLELQDVEETIKKQAPNE